jgi:hypothetical protein
LNYYFNICGHNFENMRHRFYALFFIHLLITACKDNNKIDDSAKKPPVQKTSEQNAVLNKPMYRRYVGTIADLTVIVNLTVQISMTEDGKDGYTVFGSYYYPGKSQVIDLTLNGERVTGDIVRLSESTQANAEEPLGAVWNVQITDEGVKGKWTSVDKKRTYIINLTEQYEEGAYPFDILEVDDSVSVPGKEERYTMHADFSLLVPTSKWKKEDAQFAEQQLVKELNKDTALGGQTVADFVKLRNRQLFDQYKRRVAENLKMSEDGAAANNHDYSLVSTCEYNGRGIVVLTLSTQAYMGGAHGSYWTRYICMDIRDRKVWQLRDMIKVDTAALGSMFDALLRVNYDIKPGDKLSNTFLYDTIPPAENVSISDVGITFHYNPYEIGPYVLGPVSMFLSFKELQPYLKPEFKQRWGL